MKDMSPIFTCIVLLLLVFPAGAQPGAEEAPGGGGGPRGRAGGMRAEPPSSVDWDKVAAFMGDHSPSRWKRYRDLSEDSMEKRNVRRFFWVRFQGLQELKEDDSELYQYRLSQFRIEDEIFALAVQLFATSSSQTQKEVEREMRAKYAEAVTQMMLERSLRIKRLEELLESQRQQLAHDQANFDKLVEIRMMRALQQKGDSLDRLLGAEAKPDRRAPPPDGQPEPGRREKP